MLETIHKKDYIYLTPERKKAQLRSPLKLKRKNSIIMPKMLCEEKDYIYLTPKGNKKMVNSPPKLKRKKTIILTNRVLNF
jgi:hypothetical protein